MTQQLDIEGRRTGSTRLERGRGRRLDAPAARGRARLGGGAPADEDERHPGPRRRETEPPARPEIGDLRLAPDLGEDSPDRGAADGLVGGPQDAGRVPGPDDDDPVGIAAEFRDALPVEGTGLDIDEILPGPDERPPLPGPEREAEPETRRRRADRDAAGIDLMQRAPREPAAQRAVDPRLAEGEEIGGPEGGIGFERRDGAFQRRQIGHGGRS